MNKINSLLVTQISGMQSPVHNLTEMLSNVSDDPWNKNRNIWPTAASAKARKTARSRSIIPRCPTFPRLWRVPWNLDDLLSAWQLQVWWQVQFGGQIYQVQHARNNWLGGPAESVGRTSKFVLVEPLTYNDTPRTIRRPGNKYSHNIQGYIPLGGNNLIDTLSLTFSRALRTCRVERRGELVVQSAP